MAFDQQYAIQQKIKVQKLALEESKVHPFLFLEWFTGIGKSKAALDILQHHRDGMWVIVIKETNHELTWRMEAKQWGVNLLGVHIITYDSLHKLPKNRKLNLIMDEAHAITDLRLKKLMREGLQINRIVALTATMPDEKKRLLYRLGKFRLFTITMAQAIAAKMVPEPRVIKVIVPMTNAQMKKYQALTYRINQAMWDEDEDLAKKLGVIRKRLLAGCKTWAIKKHLDYSKRFICFTGSIKQCDELGGKNVIHSKVRNRMDLIQDYNKERISNLFAVNMLRESMNLRGIEVGYVGQLDRQQKSTIQMFGRCFRSEEPLMYVFIAKGTVDESYAQVALDSVPEKYISEIPA